MYLNEDDLYMLPADKLVEAKAYLDKSWDEFYEAIRPLIEADNPYAVYSNDAIGERANDDQRMCEHLIEEAAIKLAKATEVAAQRQYLESTPRETKMEAMLVIDKQIAAMDKDMEPMGIPCFGDFRAEHEFMDKYNKLKEAKAEILATL